jgi:hypothetical protein
VSLLTTTALLLSGCSGASAARGQTTQEAEQFLRSLAGVEAAEVSVERNTSGLDTSNSNRALIILTLDPKTTTDSIDDAEVDAIIQTGWSLQANRELANGVGIGLQGAPKVSLGKVLERSGWVKTGAALPGKTSAIIPADLLRDRLGDWPAAAPTVNPEGL